MCMRVMKITCVLVTTLEVVEVELTIAGPFCCLAGIQSICVFFFMRLSFYQIIGI